MNVPNPSRKSQDVKTPEALSSVTAGSATVMEMVLRIRDADGPSDNKHAFVSHQLNKTGATWQRMPRIAQIINVIKILMESPIRSVGGLMNRTLAFVRQRRRHIALEQPLRVNAYPGSAIPTAIGA